MSEVLNTALAALQEKLGDQTFDGSVKLVIGGEGALLLNESGAAISDDEAECTLTADPETFLALMNGELDPTAAFMGGALKVDGDMSQAMKLGSLLS